MSEQVLNGFSSIQFLKTTYARHVGLPRGGFCVFDVINTICYRILVNKDFHSYLLNSSFAIPCYTPAFATRAFSTPMINRLSSRLSRKAHVSEGLKINVLIFSKAKTSESAIFSFTRAHLQLTVTIFTHFPTIMNSVPTSGCELSKIFLFLFQSHDHNTVSRTKTQTEISGIADNIILWHDNLAEILKYRTTVELEAQQRYDCANISTCCKCLKYFQQNETWKLRCVFRPWSDSPHQRSSITT